MYIYIYIYSPNSFCCRGPSGLSSGWVDSSAGLPGLRVCSFLLLYAVLGACHLHHSQLKWLLFSFTSIKHICFGSFSLKDASGAQEAWETTQEPPRCLQMSPRCLPDASHMPPDASQMPRRCLQVPPGCRQMLHRCLQMVPRCLLDASQMTLHHESSSMSPPPCFLLHDCSSMIHPP